MSSPTVLLSGGTDEAGSQTIKQSIYWRDIDCNFAHSKCTYTGIISVKFEHEILDKSTNQKRRQTALTLMANHERSQAYLWDEWSIIMNTIWNQFKSKQRDNSQLSITFFGINVKRVEFGNEEPTMTIPYYLNLDVKEAKDKNSYDSYIEFKNCIHRICGNKGIRFTNKDVSENHTENNANQCKELLRLCPQYKYTAIAELIPSNQCYVYGYVVFVGPMKTCRGKHQLSQQIQIRDGSQSMAIEPFQIMIFGNRKEQFPQCKMGDLLRIHRFTVNQRYTNSYLQGVMKLDDKKLSFIVIDGSLSLSNNQECVRHTSSEKYTFNDDIDGYCIKHLKKRNLEMNRLLNPVEIDSNFNIIEKTDARQIEQTIPSNTYLSEINRDYKRLNVVVLIVKRYEVPSDSDDDDDCNDNNNNQSVTGESNFEMNVDKPFTFYWVICDGSVCKNALFEIDENTGKGEEEVWKVDESHSSVKISGTKAKILISLSDYEKSAQMYTEINVGSFVELLNIHFDCESKHLIFDDESKILQLDVKTDKFAQQRKQLLYYNIERNSKVVTIMSEVQGKYQSFAAISSIKNCKIAKCKYRIRVRVIKHSPLKICDFINNSTNDSNEIRFVLDVMDSSGECIPIVFGNQESKEFFGLKKKNNDKNVEMERIRSCIGELLLETSISEFCIKSYKIKKRNQICYKVFNTVFHK